jgi:DNA adenine methylase
MCALRYPGGKTRAIKILEKYVPDNLNKLWSPFFGGGSFEFHIMKKFKAKIYANDKFEPLFNFWHCLKENKNKLVTEVKKLFPVSKDSFIECRKNILDNNIDKYIRGACYFVLNRSSFSGASLSGGFSLEAGKKRFTKSSITRLEKIDLFNCELTNLDFTDFINRIPDNEFIFLDPPYYLGKKSKLYGTNGDLHEEFNHENLYKCLENKKKWLLCYNDCEYIRNLYKNYKIESVNWKYGMNTTKKSSEIVITCN